MAQDPLKDLGPGDMPVLDVIRFALGYSLTSHNGYVIARRVFDGLADAGFITPDRHRGLKLTADRGGRDEG